MRRLVQLAIVAALIALARHAHALERVLVLGAEERPPSASFVEALSIQLASVAAVSAGPRLRGTLAERIDRAGKALDRSGALVGVWVEEATQTADGQREVLLYIASRRKNRVLVEVARLPALGGPDADRALALKVREVLDALIASPARDDPAVGLMPVRSQPSSESVDGAHGPSTVTGRLIVEAGGISASTLGGTGGVQAGAALGIGGRLSLRAGSVEVIATGHSLSALEERTATGYVSVSELDVGASLRLLTNGTTLSGAVRLDAAFRFVEASGEAPNGRTASASRTVPVVRVGPELRLALSRPLSLRAAIAGELALRRQRFLIDGERLLDLGVARGLGELSLVVALP